jgi:hypothetical protein
LCEIFAEIVQHHDAKPITVEELEEAVGVEALREENALVRLTQAGVDLKIGNVLGVEHWLAPLWEDAKLCG